MWSLHNLDLGGLRQKHPYWNLQTPSRWVDDGDRTVTPLRSADNLKGRTMERMKRVEDLDVSTLGTQGIVGGGGITRICIA
jgi:hypothetical protein